jgi:hypothetical protein
MRAHYSRGAYVHVVPVGLKRTLKELTCCHFHGNVMHAHFLGLLV